MRLQLTVVVATNGTAAPTSTEVEVECDPGTTAAELAGAMTVALSADLPPGGTATVQVGDVTVDGTALVGWPPILDGAAITLVVGPAAVDTPRVVSTRTPVTIAVVHGPDAGATVDLPPGLHTVGRGSEASITLDDARMSRLHAVIAVTADGVTVADAGSTNGTQLDGRRLDLRPQAARLGATIQVGDSLLVLRAHDAVPAATRAQGDGSLLVNRRTRLCEPSQPRSITLPGPPAPREASRAPWVAMLLPVPIAAVMALAFGPMMLAFAVMGPLLMAGNVVGDRLAGRRRKSIEDAAYRRELRAAEETVEAACREEVRLLATACPDPAQTLAIATSPTARLWERLSDGSDALTVSVGWSSAPARLLVTRGHGVEPEHPLLQRAPRSLSLRDHGVTGICGERDAVLGALRAMLGQLVTLHSPHDLQLALAHLPPAADRAWSWLGRLPHYRSPLGASAADGGPTGRGGSAVATLAGVVRRRVAAAGDQRPWSGPHTLLVIDGAPELRELSDLAELLEHGPSAGISIIVISDDRAGLPAAARAVLDLTAPATPELRLPGPAPSPLVVDRVGPWWAERLSRGLAPLRDASPPPHVAIPATVGLRELLRVGDHGSTAAAVADALAAAWARAPNSTSVPIGQTSEGAFRIDLATDGPHVLVAGTTGAGKSELLRTLVASLAVHNRPEHLSMVLIDYKGGAAFDECRSLPQVAALVTDLDEHLASRALVSLRAELKRRERLLAAAGVGDFASYRSGDPETRPALSRLVIVIDEFRALAEELPQFVDGLVAVAALGRSLGVHLVLATQRPAGVVTADIKANLNLRIALRLRDRSDSVDVIDSPDAATLDPLLPGRALVRVAGAPLVAFQTAHGAARSRDDRAPGLRVRGLPWGATPAPWPKRPANPDGSGGTGDGSDDGHGGGIVGEGTDDCSDDGRTDLSVVVGAVSAAAHLVGALPAPSPWLPALPERLEAATLPVPTQPLRLPIGLVDEPELQRRSTLAVSLDEPGHWAFVGGAGSGRSTALLTVAASAARPRGPQAVHLYAVSGGSLSSLRQLAQCGAHVAIDDLPRLERFVTRLSRELGRRRDALSASRHGTMTNWCEAEPSTAPSVMVLLVDDWDVLAERADDHRFGQLAGRLLGLLREGAGLGLTAVLAGDRGLLVGRAASVVTHRVVLRVDDPTDLLLAGISRPSTTRRPPGRGLLADGTEVQVALPDQTATVPARDTEAGVAESTPPPHQPWRVDALPARVSLETLPAADQADDRVAVGVGGDELAWHWLTPGLDGRQWAVVGASGSGVSTSLATMASQLSAQGRPVCVVASPSAPWAAVRADPRVRWSGDPLDIAELVTLRRRVPDLAVVVDDAHRLVDTPMDAALREVAGCADRDGGLIVVGADVESVAVQYRGLAATVARQHTGILLGPPGRTAADVLGVRVPSEPGASPGRGYLVRAGVPLPIQVASTTVRR